MELHSFSITSHLDVALQVTIAIKMIDIRLVFSDLHQQFNVEIQYKTGNGRPTYLIRLL